MNCQFVSLVSPLNSAILGYFYGTGSVTVISCVFWQCFAQDKGSIINFYPSSGRLEQICFDESYSLSKYPSVKVHLETSGRLVFESVSVKGAAHRERLNSRRISGKFHHNFTNDISGRSKSTTILSSLIGMLLLMMRSKSSGLPLTACFLPLGRCRGNNGFPQWRFELCGRAAMNHMVCCFCAPEARLRKRINFCVGQN
jgi:hypothetical protein